MMYFVATLAVTLLAAGSFWNVPAHAHEQHHEDVPYYQDVVNLGRVSAFCANAGPATLLTAKTQPVEFSLVVTVAHEDHTMFHHERTVSLDPFAGCRGFDVSARTRWGRKMNEYWRESSGSMMQLARAPMIHLLGENDGPLYKHDEPHCAPRERLAVGLTATMHAEGDPFTGVEAAIVKAVAKLAGTIGGDLPEKLLNTLGSEMASAEPYREMLGHGQELLQPGRNHVPLYHGDGSFVGMAVVTYEPLAALADTPEWDCGVREAKEAVYEQVERCAGQAHEPGEVRRKDVDDDGRREEITYIACARETTTGGDSAEHGGQIRAGGARETMCREAFRKMIRELPEGAPLPSGTENVRLVSCDETEQQPEKTRRAEAPSAETLREFRREGEPTGGGGGYVARGQSRAPAAGKRARERRSTLSREQGEQQRGSGAETTRATVDQSPETDTRSTETDRPTGPAPFEPGSYTATANGCDWPDRVVLRRNQGQVGLRVGEAVVALERTGQTTARGTWPGSEMPVELRAEGSTLHLAAGRDERACTSRYRYADAD